MYAVLGAEYILCTGIVVCAAPDPADDILLIILVTGIVICAALYPATGLNVVVTPRPDDEELIILVTPVAEVGVPAKNAAVGGAVLDG